MKEENNDNFTFDHAYDSMSANYGYVYFVEQKIEAEVERFIKDRQCVIHCTAHNGNLLHFNNKEDAEQFEQMFGEYL